MSDITYYVLAHEWKDENGSGREILSRDYATPEDAFLMCLENAIKYEKELKEKHPGDTVTRAGSGLSYAIARLGKPDVLFHHIHVVEIVYPDIENYKKGKGSDINDHKAP